MGIRHHPGNLPIASVYRRPVADQVEDFSLAHAKTISLSTTLPMLIRMTSPSLLAKHST